MKKSTSDTGDNGNGTKPDYYYSSDATRLQLIEDTMGKIYPSGTTEWQIRNQERINKVSDSVRNFVKGMTKKDVISLGADFFVGPVKDGLDFILGKDSVTGEEFNRTILAILVVMPEFGDITMDEYLKKDADFFNSSGSDVLERVASNGDILKFNDATSEFIIVTEEGIMRTYHKLNPEIHGFESNLDYWNSPKANY